MSIVKWDNLGLKFVSFTTLGVLTWDLITAQGFSSIRNLLEILDLVLICIGLIMLFQKSLPSAGNILIIGYDITLLIYGIAAVVLIRSYRPSLMFFYLFRFTLFAIGVICSQQIFRISEEISNNVYRVLMFRIRLSDRVRQIYAIVISISLFLLFALGSYPIISCSNSGGEYSTGGLIEAEYCLYKYSDGGKACSSSTDCEGACILDEFTSTSNNLVVGVCKPDNDPYGCFSYVEDGKVLGRPCTD